MDAYIVLLQGTNALILKDLKKNRFNVNKSAP